MGAKVTFKITTDSNLNKILKTDGQLIFVQDTGKLYLDFHNARVCYSGDGASTDNTGIHYKGIAQTDPTTGTFKLVGQTTDFVPELNDLVVFGTKEYLYRAGDDGTNAWYEIGDETSSGGELLWEVEE